ERLFRRLAKRLSIHTVLEYPAWGVKAMPSIYSLGFALAGCQVTLVDAHDRGLQVWKELGLTDRLQLLSSSDFDSTQEAVRGWDLCWNFNLLPTVDQPQLWIERMAKFSRRWVLFVHVNRFNVGFGIHRTVHKLWRIPWTHGDTHFFSPFHVCNMVQQQDFTRIRWGVVDCPPWPDSLGFRDLRLHRSQNREREWSSPYAQALHHGDMPKWVKWVYLGERLPLPALLKLPYAHLFYVIFSVERHV
ncbi:MAG: hypothetical protein ABH878_07945, partial [bacterium]